MQMRLFLILTQVLFTLTSIAQTSVFRYYPQTHPSTVPGYYGCEMKPPVKTSDNGYVFSYLPYVPNIHSYYPYDTYTIKTDSNFVPQWKKPFFSKAIPLPTGGIILVYNTMISNNKSFIGSYIEKVTASGVQVFQKEFIGENIVINDGVLLGNSLRLVGRKRGDTGFPLYLETSKGFTTVFDTVGNMVSQSLFNSSPSVWTDFTRIETDVSGNFFCYGPVDERYSNGLVLAKFTSSFTPLWSTCITNTNTNLRIEDIDILPGGNIIASANVIGTPGNAGTLIKLSSQGIILSQKQISGLYRVSGLCKKGNGNYVVSGTKWYWPFDTLVGFEMDTSLNIQWYRIRGFGIKASTSFIKNNLLYTTAINDFDPYLISSDTVGANCSSSPIPYTFVTGSLQPVGYTLSAVSGSATVINSSLNILQTQVYYDSCACIPFVTAAPPNICVGSTATFSISGTGNLSWYSTQSGNSYLAGGPTYTMSSGSPGVYTVYAQDSACSNANRIAITFTFNAVPVVTVTASSINLCKGQSSTLNLSGASNYSINNTAIPPNLGSPGTTSAVINPSSTSVYTITGSNAPACNDRKLLQVTVTPVPTLTINYTNQFPCAGQSITVTINGAQTYSWSTGSSSSSLVLIPSAGFYTLTATGYNGICSKTVSSNFLAQNSPTISVMSSPPSICVGAQATLSAFGGTNFQWSIPASGATATVNPMSTTIYTVTGGSLSNTCTATKTIQVTVHTLPTVSLVASQMTFCAGNTVTLSASGAQSYVWNNNLSSGASHAVSPMLPQTYVVTGTSSNNCLNSATVSVNVLPSPTITVNNGTICSGQSFVLNPSGAATYTFSGGSGTVTPFSAITVYTISGSAGNGCTGTATAQVLALICTGVQDPVPCKVSVYPNPASEIVSVAGCDNHLTFWLYDCKGQLVMTRQSDDIAFDINIKALSSGFYSIFLSSGSFSGHFRLVKN